MNNILDVTREFSLQAQSLGKDFLAIKHPDEFELYLVAIELLDGNSKTLKYFLFPVMPNSIDVDKTWVHSIKKTLGGMSVISSETFTSTHINLSGSFGRKFRVLVNNIYEDLENFFSTDDVESNSTSQQFSTKVKTGYGSCKILERIIEESVKTDKSGPKLLIFHNLAFGKSYIVKNMKMTFTQSQDSNMIWNYNLSFQSIAPISSLYTVEKLEQIYRKLAVNNFLQKGVSNIIDGTRRILTSVTDYSLKPL